MDASYTLAHSFCKSLAHYSAMHSSAMDPRSLLQRLMDAEGLNPNSLAAATKNKTKQPQIFRFLGGVSKEPRRSTLEPVAKHFRVPVDAFFDAAAADRVWADRFGDKPQYPKGGAPHEGARTGGVLAQMLSEVQPIIEPRTVLWETILIEPLPPQFKLTLPDDALAPAYPMGSLFIWSTTKAPRVGSVVLVRDSFGQPHARRYGQGRAPGQWIAEATGPGFLPFDGAAVTLLAVAEEERRPMP